VLDRVVIFVVGLLFFVVRATAGSVCCAYPRLLPLTSASHLRLSPPPLTSASHLRLSPPPHSLSHFHTPHLDWHVDSRVARSLEFFHSFIRRKLPAPSAVRVNLHCTAQASMAKRRRKDRGPRQEQRNMPASRNQQSRNLYDSLREVEGPIGESMCPGCA
jgi:hypothetical protein